VEHIGKREMHVGLWWGSMKEDGRVDDAGINGRIMWSSESRMGRCGLD